MTRAKVTVTLANLEELIAQTCNEHVDRWKTEGKKYIDAPSFEQIYAEGNFTSIELESTLSQKLKKLNKENPAIPPASARSHMIPYMLP